MAAPSPQVAPEPPPTHGEIDRVLAWAIRAPSLLNTQPWRFVVERVGPGAGPAVHLYADRSRQLRALDPHGRELTMSCGAALLYLRVAARHEGWEAEVLPYPAPSAPDFLAAVTFRRGGRPTGDDRPFRALTLRRTNRRPFRDEPVPSDLAAEMEGAAAVEGASLRMFDGASEKDTLGHLVAAGVIAQGADPDVTAELQAWLRPTGDPRPDGVRDSAQGVWDRHASMRTPASAVAAHKEQLVREAPAVLVLWTAGDGRRDWLAAGQALARVLVVAADGGLAASYANEPIEVADLRPRVAALVGGGSPQAVFRVGAPDDEPESARRPARDVVEHRAVGPSAEPYRGVHPGHAVDDDRSDPFND